MRSDALLLIRWHAELSMLYDQRKLKTVSTIDFLKIPCKKELK